MRWSEEKSEMLIQFRNRYHNLAQISAEKYVSNCVRAGTKTKLQLCE